MSGLRVSLNEVLRLAKRVFLALGAGPGCEYEPARAVVWLESRGLPGLTMLLRDCEVARGAGTAVMKTIPDGAGADLRLHAGGASGAWIAAAVVDWLVATGESGAATVEAVRSPLWFLPELAARGDAPSRWMSARDLGGALVLAATFNDRGPALQFGREPGELPGREATVSLGHGVSGGGLPDVAAGGAACLDAGELDARYRASLTAGIMVNRDAWTALYEVARGALVPETEASRARGAGAQGE